MPTLGDLIDEVKSNLQGYTLRQDRITYLNSAITASDTAIVVGNSDNLGKGIIEIDDELIWIDSFNKANNTLNVIPGFGRGYQQTNPSPHAQYAQVTLAPTFPRVSIQKAINDTINSFYPKLWAVYASWQTTGSSQEWLPINKWRVDGMANAATFNTNVTINLYENIQPGRTVQVWYTAEADTLDNATDDFADVTGLPDSCSDVVVLGACYKLLSFLDAGRINLTSAEADFADSKLPATAGAGASRYIFALYQQRLNEEALKLADKFPIRLHYTK